MLRFLKRSLALVCALSIIGITAGLAPSGPQGPAPPSVRPPDTPGPDEVAMALELASIRSRTGMLGEPNGSLEPQGGVPHTVAPGETAETLAQTYRVGAPELLDFNQLRRESQVRAGMQIQIPGTKELSGAPLFGGGVITYRASEHNNFPWGWCTWYVAQRRDIPWKGDAWTWYRSAQAAGWATGRTPRAGAIMVTEESYWYGHVAYVETVNADGSWLVSEMNYKQWGAVDYRTVYPGKVPLIGFVY